MKPFWLLLAFLALPVFAIAPGDAVTLPKIQDSYNKTVDLEAKRQQGKYLVFWFFPKSLSPGCTAQAKRYTDLYAELQQAGAEVFGVSSDPSSEQCDFIEKLSLKGGMLPDKAGVLSKLFGVDGLFGFYNRDTILVSPKGRIEQIWRGVNPFNDADNVLAYLKKVKR